MKRSSNIETGMRELSYGARQPSGNANSSWSCQTERSKFGRLGPL